MPLSISKFVLVLILSLVLTGCGAGPQHGSPPEVNGYVCTQCPTKFFTGKNEYAEVCPQCRSVALARVVGYQCERDQTVTLTTRDRNAVACSQCGARADFFVLPSEEDLRDWGASRRKRTEVSM